MVVHQSGVLTVADLCTFEGTTLSRRIDLVTVFDAILTSRETREKLQCLYENLMSNNFRRTAFLKKNMGCKLKRHS